MFVSKSMVPYNQLRNHPQTEDTRNETCGMIELIIAAMESNWLTENIRVINSMPHQPHEVLDSNEIQSTVLAKPSYLCREYTLSEKDQCQI
jgi:hypothetical protein